jgi:hypothetical protein
MLIFLRGGGLILGGVEIILRVYGFLEFGVVPVLLYEAYDDLGAALPTVKVPFGEVVLRKEPVGSTGLPLLEHDKQTLKIDFSIITFLLTSVCFPHNSQKETIRMVNYSDLIY